MIQNLKHLLKALISKTSHHTSHHQLSIIKSIFKLLENKIKCYHTALAFNLEEVQISVLKVSIKIILLNKRVLMESTKVNTNQGKEITH